MPKEKSSKEMPDHQQEKQIELVWGSAEDLPTVYATQLLISHTGAEFYLIFGEVVTPAILGKHKEPLPAKLKVKPVVKLAFPYVAMPEIANLITQNVKSFMETVEKMQKESEGSSAE